MQCKFCTFVGSNQDVLLRHHRLRHGRGAHWPCIHIDCASNFKTAGSLRSHLSRSHSRTTKPQEKSHFSCELCEFRDLCTERKFLVHLGHHLRKQEIVHCPFQRCDFETNNLKSFSSHKSRNHKNHTLRKIQTSEFSESEPHVVDQPFDDLVEAGTSQSVLTQESCENVSSEYLEDVDAKTLEHKLASLFLCMQTLLHVSKNAVQKIVEEFHDILQFSKFHSLQKIKEVLTKHNIEIDDSVAQEINEAIFKTNPLILTTEPKGVLSTDHRRNQYFKEHFPITEPTEYLYEQTHKNTFVYVSITQVLESLLRRTDVLEKVVFSQEHLPGQYRSIQDGQYFKDNKLLGEQETSISIGLYIDDFEICNPLGTSKKFTSSLLSIGLFSIYLQSFAPVSP